MEPCEEPLASSVFSPLAVESSAGVGQGGGPGGFLWTVLMTVFIGCEGVMCVHAHVGHSPVYAGAEPETDLRSSSSALHLILKAEPLTEPGACCCS